MSDIAQLRALRWRMILGEEADGAMSCSLGAQGERIDGALGFLYDREYGAARNIRRRSGKGTLDQSQITVPEWINTIHELFPQPVIERLQKDALDRYGLNEMVTDASVLQQVQPSMTMLKAVLQTKHLMNQDVLAEARRLVKKVVDDLVNQIARPIRSPFFGALDPRRRSHIKIARNFDAKTTIERNLAHYDPVSRRIFIRRPFFSSRVKRHIERWQVIILVDQSGSMIDAVIHSAITASIFRSIRDFDTHLVVFDTSVVDLTAECIDPVETLMKVQLGGGTDIGRALRYGEGLIRNPRRSLIVLISDFYEGGPEELLYKTARRIVDSGATLLGLAALDGGARPEFDRQVAQRLVDIGAHVAAMTPDQLASWVAEHVR